MIGSVQEVIDELFVKSTIEVSKEQLVIDPGKIQSQIYNEDCLATMERMKKGTIDFVITSPPYGNLREYHGYKFEFEEIVKSLFRVLSRSGVLVWIVGDQTIEGDEQGIPFEQVLFFKKIGFKLHDTMIFFKKNPPPISQVIHKRYQQSFEFMFIFSKDKLKVFNPIMVPSTTRGLTRRKPGKYSEGVFLQEDKEGTIKDKRIKSNVWSYVVGGRLSIGQGHPAIFPEQLVEDHLLSWTEVGDIVYDPMMGSGTTGVICKKLDRYFIGSEISKEYCDLALHRMNKYL